MSDACLSCGNARAGLRRGCCPTCVKLIREDLIPDARLPSRRNAVRVCPPNVRSADAVRQRMAATLARYPHLRRP